MPIKTTMKYHYRTTKYLKFKNVIPQDTIENAEKMLHSYLAGGNINYFSHYGEEYGDFPKVLKVELPYGLVIPLLSTYPNKSIIQSLIQMKVHGIF